MPSSSTAGKQCDQKMSKFHQKMRSVTSIQSHFCRTVELIQNRGFYSTVEFIQPWKKIRINSTVISFHHGFYSTVENIHSYSVEMIFFHGGVELIPIFTI